MLIRLKKYLNQHENSCSKVISILITGNGLHESPSAPQQHKSVRYKWFALYLHRDVSYTDMLQPHEFSSAPQQHKSVQYKWFALYLHRDISHTDMLQPDIISCRGVSGAGGNMSGSRNLCQIYLVLSLFYS